MADFDIASYVSHIEANRTVKDALMQKLKTRRAPYRISVTDLLNLKQAYFKRKHPEITPPLEKQQLMWAGTGFHKNFGPAVSSEEYLEQFVEAEGIVGKIDIYENIPVEVKTTAAAIGTAEILKYRPSYIEQLGMYCAMVNAAEGEIIIYRRHHSTESHEDSFLSAYRVTFPRLEAIQEEMRRRKDLLMQALISNDPSNLPICAWFGRGCDYSAVCDCGTSSPSLSYKIAELAGKISSDELTQQQLMEKVARRRPSRLFKVNEIVFPRKAYFERRQIQQAMSEKGIAEEKEEYLQAMEEVGFIDILRDLLRYGAPGEVRNVPVQYDSLSDLVQIRHGLPTMVRSPRLQSLVPRERLPQVFPHYFLRLGFDCALTGHPQSRLLLYYANVPEENAKLMVYDVTLTNLNELKTEAIHRLELLEKATSPAQLPRCPSWMCRYCSYKAECGGA